jgi:hypothetical protein
LSVDIKCSATSRQTTSHHRTQQDTSAEEFAQHWNFLCNLQDPTGPTSRWPDHLEEVDQNLDDIEDFLEDEPERRIPPEDLDLDHEWFQLIQMEKAIEEKKNKLRGNEAQQRRYPDEDHETFWKDGEGLTEQGDNLDDKDLE